MKTLEQRKWFWQYALPTAILVLAVALTLLIGEWLFGLEDLSIFTALVIVPIVAFLVGLVFRPEWVAVIAVAAVVLWEIPIFLSRGMDDAVGTIFFVVLLVGLPIALLIWAGKAMRPWVDDKLVSRGDGPRAPA